MNKATWLLNRFGRLTVMDGFGSMSDGNHYFNPRRKDRPLKTARLKKEFVDVIKRIKTERGLK